MMQNGKAETTINHIRQLSEPTDPQLNIPSTTLL